MALKFLKLMSLGDEKEYEGIIHQVAANGIIHWMDINVYYIYITYICMYIYISHMYIYIHIIYTVKIEDDQNLWLFGSGRSILTTRRNTLQTWAWL